jgi:hypothetical protein
VVRHCFPGKTIYFEFFLTKTETCLVFFSFHVLLGG